MFQPSPEDHEKYGGDPEHPHKLHIVTRIKSTKRRPYWEKDVIKLLRLEKAHTPQVHKNISSVNAKLKVVKHLIRIKSLRLPQGLPAEEDMAHPRALGASSVVAPILVRFQTNMRKPFLLKDGEKVSSLKYILDAIQKKKKLRKTSLAAM